MNDDRVMELLETYGADRMVWPEDERAAAWARIAASPALRAALDQARALDRLIMPQVGTASGALKARIMFAVDARRMSLGARIARALGVRDARNHSAVMQPAGILAMSLVAGLVVGTYTTVLRADTQLSGDQIEVAAISDLSIEVAE